MSQNDWKWTSDDDLKMIRFFDQYLVTRNDETEKTIADPTTDPKYETKDDLENRGMFSKSAFHHWDEKMVIFSNI
jgi:hypothetical protein